MWIAFIGDQRRGQELSEDFARHFLHCRSSFLMRVFETLAKYSDSA
jgi:hypothetical protein